MADYKEQAVAGKQWTRCNLVLIDNTFNAAPSISFQEEQVTIVGEEIFKKNSGSINLTFDPSRVIPLIDPATGNPTGATTTFGEIQVALWSLYMAEAVARDSAGG